MYQIDFKKPIAIHFIGIGGISMSGLAEILMREGFRVSGSDSHESELTDHLAAAGAKVMYGQAAANITDDIDLVVYTAAVHTDNPEYAEVVRRGIPMMPRAELLGQIMKNYGEAIAISGTHGKTTTTSMVTEILLAAEKDPTISVGGILHSIGGNIRVGGPELFVTEACEYTNSFLSFFPNREVILNIEADHLDFFKDIDDIRHSFRLFAQKLPKDGLLVINTDIDRYEEIVDGLECRIVTCGKRTDSNYRAEDITYDHFARAAFRLMIDGQDAGEITLGVPGEHNVYNALAAAAVTLWVGVPAEKLQHALEHLKINGRMEIVYTSEKCCVIVDYAHNAVSMESLLATLREYHPKRLVVVFGCGGNRSKDRRYSMGEIGGRMADLSIITADNSRFEKVEDIIADIRGSIEKTGGKFIEIPDRKEAITYSITHAEPGDMIAIIGKGHEDYQEINGVRYPFLDRAVVEEVVKNL